MAYEVADELHTTVELYIEDLFDEFTKDNASEHVFCVTPKLQRIIGS